MKKANTSYFAKTLTPMLLNKAHIFNCNWGETLILLVFIFCLNNSNLMNH